MVWLYTVDKDLMLIYHRSHIYIRPVVMGSGLRTNACSKKSVVLSPGYTTRPIDLSAGYLEWWTSCSLQAATYIHDCSAWSETSSPDCCYVRRKPTDRGPRVDNLAACTHRACWTAFCLQATPQTLSADSSR
jgi:hypothetical protein